MECLACKEDVHPVHEIGGDRGMISRCPRLECRAAFPDAKPATLTKTEPTLLAPVIPMPLSTPGAAAGQTTNQILDAAHARLEWVDAEIERLAHLKAERATLRRMIGKKR